MLDFIIDNWMLVTGLLLALVKLIPSPWTTDAAKLLFMFLEKVWGIIPDNALGGGKFVRTNIKVMPEKDA